VKRILVDGDTVWVGTSGGAIRYRAASDEYKLFDARSGLLVDSVIFVGKAQGRIVVGTRGGGMALLEPESERWENFGTGEGLADRVVHDVLQAANGDIWIATPSGVNRVRAGALRQRSSWERHTPASTKQGLPSDRVYALAEGREGDIWLATESGVALHRKGNWSHWSPAHSSQSEMAQSAPRGAPGRAAPAARTERGARRTRISSFR
jgi:ligand-binding sensor domain-containing protein